jgi:hypothetical protein
MKLSASIKNSFTFFTHHWALWKCYCFMLCMLMTTKVLDLGNKMFCLILHRFDGALLSRLSWFVIMVNNKFRRKKDLFQTVLSLKLYSLMFGCYWVKAIALHMNEVSFLISMKCPLATFWIVIQKRNVMLNIEISRKTFNVSLWRIIGSNSQLDNMSWRSKLFSNSCQLIFHDQYWMFQFSNHFQSNW